MLELLVIIGLDWSLLPEILLAEHLKPLDIPELDLTRSPGIETHRKRTQSNTVVAMRRSLRDRG